MFQDLHTFETFFFRKGLDLGVRKMLFLSGRRAEKKTKMMPLPIQSSQCGSAYRLLRRTIPPLTQISALKVKRQTGLTT